MHETLPLLQQSGFPEIRRCKLTTLQVNLGYLCNQQCLHCHVNAGPNRKEVMSNETLDQVKRFLAQKEVTTLDLTGGAPELNPGFRDLVSFAVGKGIHVMDRCNLTVLEQPDQEDTAQFLAQNGVEITASMPCYLEENVDAQRGNGVFASSIRALQKLNTLGYGKPGSGLVLNLVYNPQGPVLPPPQCALEADYRKHLFEHFQVEFSHLYTLANMPIKRFGSTLVSKGKFNEYMRLLMDSAREENLENVMCRDLVSVDWEGYLYDCDFNQMLDLPMRDAASHKMHISTLEVEQLIDRPVIVADHCYGCIAGQGSSCGGALDEEAKSA
jgi:radical SAM/Cys-rich protein